MINSNDLIAVLREEISKQTALLREDLDTVRKEIREVGEDTRRYIASLDGRLLKLEEEIVNIKRIIIKNNIIVSGLVVDDADLLNSCISRINELLEINLSPNNINNIYKLGRDQHSPIKIEFTSYLTKNLVLKNSRKLKGKKIYINNDLCPEDRRKDKLLRSNLKQARSRNLNAYVRNQKLYINGDEYTYEELEKQTVKEKSSSGSESEILDQTFRELRDTPRSAPDTPNPVTRLEQQLKEQQQIEGEESVGEKVSKLIEKAGKDSKKSKGEETETYRQTRSQYRVHRN